LVLQSFPQTPHVMVPAIIFENGVLFMFLLKYRKFWL
jgi:hypothetical protein